MIGQVIGNYRIVSELGKGGMGVVFGAEHVQLGRPAAIKMLLPQLSNDAGIVQRFFNEARAASSIDHPGIVEVYDFGRHTDGCAYIVMALLKGESLEHRLRLRGSLAPQEGATIVAQVAGALAAAHARGIVHRDLKPDNVFLVPNELMPGGVQVKLLDFGIAKLTDDQGAEHKTQTGVMMGTPAYMSPEQCMGRSDLDHRTDLYSIGCILFHVLCGRPPFASDQGTGMTIASHLRDPAPDPRSLNPNVPADLAAIIHRLLEKDPAARFQSATELRAALVAAGATTPTTRPPVTIDVMGATMVPGAAPVAVSMAPQPTTQSTTASGSAAEVVSRASPAPRGTSKRGLAIALGGVLVAAAGIGGFVVMRDRAAVAPVAEAPHAPSVVPTVTAPLPAPTPATSLATGERAVPSSPAGSSTSPAIAPTRPPPDNAHAALALAPCPAGQDRRADTHGQCCWPEQAWSLAKGGCVGTPSCPPGTKARRDQCVVVNAEAAPSPRRMSPPPEIKAAVPGTTAVRSFTLRARSMPVGGTIEIRFRAPARSTSQQRLWVTVVPADAPAPTYETWEFVEDGTTSAKLVAPAKPGRYEVRLHANYPTKAHDLQHMIPIKVTAAAEIASGAGSGTSAGSAGFGGSAGSAGSGVSGGSAVPQETPRSSQRFVVADRTLSAGTKVQLKFAAPLHAASGEQFWVTVVAAGAADSTWGSYEYVPAGARAMALDVPKVTGEYELRLHANYPTQSTNVVHRIAIRVE